MNTAYKKIATRLALGILMSTATQVSADETDGNNHYEITVTM